MSSNLFGFQENEGKIVKINIPGEVFLCCIFMKNASSICLPNGKIWKVSETGISVSLFLVSISFLFLLNFQFLEALMIEIAKIGFFLSLFFCLFSGFFAVTQVFRRKHFFANQVVFVFVPSLSI